ncbi:phage integrase family protein [Geobacter sp. OR-1]|nr:phage integrase family protein [Geobacter sp. OR-1]
MTAADCKALAIEITNADKTIYEIEKARLRGDWKPLELLEEKVARELAAQQYIPLKEVADLYLKRHIESNTNPDMKRAKALEAEVNALLDIFGNTSISEFNTMDSSIKLKSVLKKYPRNKTIVYGDKSIHSIIRTEKNYNTISLTTANKYIKTAKSMVDFALKAHLINTANVYKNETFRSTVAADDQRPAYADADIIRLVDALCTRPLWKYRPAKDERFWIVLIVLFHGMRLDNIVALTKKDICQLDNGLWVFALQKGKRAATRRPVAICDALLLLGFLEWVDSLDRIKLFTDSSKQFSAWYNFSPSKISGFENGITDDPRKCLYSLRHSFAGNVYEVAGDIKIAADMLGQSTGGNVTARYVKATKAKALKEISDKMSLDCIDLDKLEARVKELFPGILGT